MYVYILTGKLFGKDIYEISVTDDLSKRIESDEVGYPNDNKILFTEKIKFHDPEKFKKLLSSRLTEFKIGDQYYKIKIESAKKVILNFLEFYDVEPKPIQTQKSKGCLWF